MGIGAKGNVILTYVYLPRRKIAENNTCAIKLKLLMCSSQYLHGVRNRGAYKLVLCPASWAGNLVNLGLKNVKISRTFL